MSIPRHHLEGAYLTRRAYADPDFAVLTAELAFGVINDKPAYAIAGTEDLSDWRINARAMIPAYRKQIGLHPWGYMRESREIARAIQRHAVSNQVNLHEAGIIGHSKGGAEAVCTAAALHLSGFLVSWVMTMGAPETGAMRCLRYTQIDQYRNGNDQVNRTLYYGNTREPILFGDPEGFDHPLDAYIMEMEALQNGGY